MSEQKKSKKFGRNKIHCLAYRNENRREKSHVRRIRKHLSRYGFGDRTARDRLMELSIACGVRTVQSTKEFLANRV